LLDPNTANMPPFDQLTQQQLDDLAAFLLAMK